MKELTFQTRTAPDHRWDNDVAQIAHHYQKKIEHYHGVSARSLDWRTRGVHRKVFDQATSFFQPALVQSVFDVGCGEGVFHQHLRRKGFHGKYSGIDVVPEFISAGRTRGERGIQSGNFLTIPIRPDSYDVVVNLGGLNSRAADYEEYVSSVIRRMLTMARTYVIFNVILEADAQFFPHKNNTRVGHITDVGRGRLQRILSRLVQDFPSCRVTIHEVQVFPHSIDAFVCLEKMAVGQLPILAGSGTTIAPSWAQIDTGARRVASQLDCIQFDTTVTVVRGGMFLSLVISHQTGQKKLEFFRVTKNRTDQPHTYGTVKIQKFPTLQRGEKIIVVEDILFQGATTKKLLQHCRSRGVRVMAICSLILDERCHIGGFQEAYGEPVPVLAAFRCRYRNWVRFPWERPVPNEVRGRIRPV